MIILWLASEHDLVGFEQSVLHCFLQSHIHTGSSSVPVTKYCLLPSYLCAVSLCIMMAKQHNRCCKKQK